jgi:hypothetical protein
MKKKMQRYRVWTKKLRRMKSITKNMYAYSKKHITTPTYFVFSVTGHDQVYYILIYINICTCTTTIVLLYYRAMYTLYIQITYYYMLIFIYYYIIILFIYNIDTITIYLCLSNHFLLHIFILLYYLLQSRKSNCRN